MSISDWSSDVCASDLCVCLLTCIYIIASAIGLDQEPVADEPIAEAVETEPFWLWMLLGRFHPLIVHFPVGLLCVALLLELIDWKGKSAALRNGIQIGRAHV